MYELLIQCAKYIVEIPSSLEWRIDENTITGMKALRDIVDFRDSYFAVIPQHYQYILLIHGANAAVPSAYTICGENATTTSAYTITRYLHNILEYFILLSNWS